jgi:hypothetical protein
MAGVLIFLALFALQHPAQQVNWTGPYAQCHNSSELKKTGHLSAGVRYDLADPVIVRQFHEAFEFWARVLDAEFYDDRSNSCAVAIVSGTRELLKNRLTVARAQMPDRSGFEGWIAVDPGASGYLTEDEAVPTWIHEIGHLLGLKHNASAGSVMYYFDADGSSRLDSTDLHELALRHALRPVPVIQSLRMSLADESSASSSPSRVENVTNGRR